MNIPNYIHMPVTNNEGHFSDSYMQFFSQLIDQMQTALSDEGFQIPHQTAANIAILQGSSSVPNGTLVYDSDNNLLKVKISGIFKTITTS